MNPDDLMQHARGEEEEEPPKAGELATRDDAAVSKQHSHPSHKRAKRRTALPILLASYALWFTVWFTLYPPLVEIATLGALALSAFVIRGPRLRYGRVAGFLGAVIYACQLVTLGIATFRVVYNSPAPALFFEVTLIGVAGVGIAMYLLATWIRNGSLVLMPVALVVILVSGSWAWKLASSQFAPVPVISDPGAIMIATYGSSNNHNGIKTYVEYQASVNQPSTHYSIDFLQQGEGTSPEIVIFLCGAAATDANFTNYSNDGGAPGHTPPVVWYSASQFDGYSFGGAGFTFPDHCIYALIPLIFNAGSESSSALLIGSSGPPPNRVSGAGITYAWPGILALPEPDAISGPDFTPPQVAEFTVGSLTAGSSYTVSLSGVPADISNVVTNPDLTINPWGFQAAESFNNSFTGYYPEFRLSGDLSDIQAAGQRNLFIAGALVGVAGGAVIWLLELLMKTLLALRSLAKTEAAKAKSAYKGRAEKGNGTVEASPE